MSTSTFSKCLNTRKKNVPLTVIKYLKVNNKKYNGIKLEIK